MLLKRPSAILGTSMLERLGSSSLSGAAQILEGKMGSVERTCERIQTDGLGWRSRPLRLDKAEQQNNILTRCNRGNRNSLKSLDFKQTRGTKQNKVALRLLYIWSSRQKALSARREGPGGSFGFEFLPLRRFELALWIFSYWRQGCSEGRYVTGFI